jgi:LysR family transcriptional activator of nhaA
MVHRKGSFQQAAKEMFVSQSTVSEQVKHLEEYMQQQLIERLPRKIRLTATGKELFKYADEIFSKSREINHFIKDGATLDQALNLKVGTTGSISRNLLYRFFSNALKDKQISGFHIIGGQNHDLVKACDNYEIDFFISDEPPQGQDILNLHTKVLFQSLFIFAGKKRMLEKLKKGKEVDLFYFKHPFVDESVLSELEERYEIKINKVIETDDISLLRFFANSGDGISLLPQIGVHEDLIKKYVFQIELPELEKVNFYLNYPKTAARGGEILKLLSSNSFIKTAFQ